MVPSSQFRCGLFQPFQTIDSSQVNNAGVATQFPYKLTVDGVESTFQAISTSRCNETRAISGWGDGGFQLVMGVALVIIHFRLGFSHDHPV